MSDPTKQSDWTKPAGCHRAARLSCGAQAALPAVVMFPIKGETYFMYQGIFDTDFDKYTEDAITLFGATGQVRARSSVPELS